MSNAAYLTPAEKERVVYLLKLKKERVTGPTIDARVPPSWFHEGQLATWASRARDVVNVAGAQGGKTSGQAPWLEREIQRCAPLIKRLGEGKFIYAGPTLTLMRDQAIRAFRRHFQSELGLGDMAMSPKPLFTLSKEGSEKLLGFSDCPVTVHFAYTNDSSNLESMTALAGAWDEAGQKENLQASHEAFDRRLSLARSTTFGTIREWLKETHQESVFAWWIERYFDVEGPEATFGRRIWGSTPYEWGWWKTDVHDRAERGEHGYQLFNFPTWMNPLQSETECRAKLTEGMPVWRWLMMYAGQFTKPAGLIYDCFDWDRNTTTDKKIPSHWKLYPGADFGNVNFAGGIIAEDPDSKTLYVIGEYLAGENRTVKQNCDEIKKCISADAKLENPSFNPGAGGSHQEEGWRDAASAHGLMLDEPPVNDVEVQIGCVYAAFATGNLVIFRSCRGLIDQIQTYARELGPDQQPTEKIANKSIYHHADWLRYVLTKLRPPRVELSALPINPSSRLVGVSRRS
jgi:hypothetical protein